MTDLESRFRHAAEADSFGQPNLGAIVARANTRARNKRLAGGAASLAVLALGALSLTSVIDGTSEVVEAADGSLAVDVNNGDDSLVSLDDSNDTVSEAVEAEESESATGDEEPSDEAEPAAVESDSTGEETEQVAQPILDVLTEEFELCFSYDNESGAGTLEIWAENGEVVNVDERRVRGSQDDLAYVFNFAGQGTADGLTIETTGDYIAEGMNESSAETRSYLFAGDLSTVAGQEFVYVSQTCDTLNSVGAPVFAEALPDGSGGSLVIDPDQGLIHQRADGTQTVVELPAIEATAVQRWPTDVAPIGGTYHLFVDQFVNVEPGPGEVDHFEVSILALNLETDAWIEVERRIITDAEGPEWIYNGHITTNGEQILVMREFWQSACLYAEALTLSGELADAPEIAAYPAPTWLDAFTKEQAVTLSDADPDNDFIFDPCVGLNEIGDGGLAALGRFAEPEAFASFEADFLLRYG